MAVIENRKFRDELGPFLKSGVTGTKLARDPSRFPNVANALQAGIDIQMNRFGFVAPLAPASTSNFFAGTSFAFDFHNAQQSLKRDFVDAEIDRQFGQQNVTSQSSIVDSSGQRVPVSGQGTTTPTAAQRAKIESGFLSPLQRVIRRLPPAAPVGGADRKRAETIVSGAGTQRRRRAGAQAQTILTSDADGPIGGQTLLG